MSGEEFQVFGFGARKNLIDYILLAEFDIDKGSTVRHQYPSDIPVQPGNLAESMLPEGGHLRDTDWTVFFIRKSELENIQYKTLGDAGVVTSGSKEEEQNRKRQKLKQKIAGELKGDSWNCKALQFDNDTSEWLKNGSGNFVSGGTYERKRSISGESLSSGNNFNNAQLENSSIELHSVFFDVERSESNQSSESNFSLKITLSGAVVREIPIHLGIIYSVRDHDNRAILQDSSGSSIALVFANQNDLLRFEKAIHCLFDLLKGILPDEEVILDEDVEKKCEEILEEANMLICLNLVRTKKDQSVRRGAIVKSMAFCTTRRDIHVFKSALLFALTKYFEIDSVKDGFEFLKEVYTSLNTIDLSEKPSLTDLERRVYRANWANMSSLSQVGNGKSTIFRTHVGLRGVKIPINFPLMMEDDEIGGASVINLCKKFQEGTMKIFNAILLGKRIIFLGHNLPAGEVCEMVLSACLLVAPLRGTLKRAYPYAHLTDIKFLETDGFIAGVTNPIFEQHKQWWDVLCDIGSGIVTLSNSYEQDLQNLNHEESYETMDAEIIWKVRSKIGLLFGEQYIRSLFRDYTTHVLDMALGIEEFPSDARRLQCIKANMGRISELRKQSLFKDYEVIFRMEQLNSTFKKAHHLEIRNYIRMLQVKKMSSRETVRIYRELKKHTNSKEELMELLALLPESRGGLAPIALGMFHVSDRVKQTTLHLLNLLDSLEEGSRVINSLNKFIKLTFHKYKDSSLAKISDDNVDDIDYKDEIDPDHEFPSGQGSNFTSITE